MMAGAVDGAAVQEITGAPARTFHQWVVDNASAFRRPGSER